MRTVIILGLALLGLAGCGPPPPDRFTLMLDAWVERQNELAQEKADYEATLTPDQLMAARLADISDAIRVQTIINLPGAPRP